MPKIQKVKLRLSNAKNDESPLIFQRAFYVVA